MRDIRRTAVTGLFALWLAPLSAMAESQAANAAGDGSDGASTHIESPVIEDRDGRRGWVRQLGWRARDGLAAERDSRHDDDGRASG